MDTPIFIIHGIGCTQNDILPLKINLMKHGHINVYVVKYRPNYTSFETSLDDVDRYMRGYITKETEITLIGHSYGGVIANSIHKKGWRIKHAIYVAAPLNGSSIIKKFEWCAPILRAPACQYLKSKDKDDPPPHLFTTISMGWFWSKFDGKLFKRETIINPSNHIHISFSDHVSIASVKVMKIIRKALIERS